MADPRLSWVVADAPPQGEFAAQYAIRALGFPVFVATQTRWRLVNRRSKTREPYAAPMISRYLFIAAADPETVYRVFDTGLAVSTDDRPGSLLVLSGALLRDFVDRNSVHCEVRSRRHDPAPFAPGDDVTVVTGPFENWSGVVASCNGVRATVKINSHFVSFSVDDLRAG